jgi:hypothetical protein
MPKPPASLKLQQLAELRQSVPFDMNQLLDFEAGAWFMALMMHPAASEIDVRRDAFILLCASFVAAAEKSDPEVAALFRVSRPEYFGLAPKAYRRVLREAKSAMSYRMVAAIVARPFVERAKEGKAYKLPPELSELVLSNVVECVSAIHNVISGENIMQRAWRPSAPVLHLVIGLESAMQQLSLATSSNQEPDELIEPLALPFDLQEIELVRLAVHLSHEAAGIIRNDPAMKIDPTKLVEIRWTERN